MGPSRRGAAMPLKNQGGIGRPAMAESRRKPKTDDADGKADKKSKSRRTEEATPKSRRSPRHKMTEVDEQAQKRRDMITLIMFVVIAVGAIAAMFLLSKFLSGS
jgi:predicted nucleic acid-binding Zn ribbon protein